MNFPGVKIGLMGIVQKKVNENKNIVGIGGKSLKVLLSTPDLIALMIEASIKAVDHLLVAPIYLNDLITIGKSLTINHHKPTFLGSVITVKSILKSLEGNKLIFEITAYDEIGLIASGIHERYIVSEKGIIEKAIERKEQMKIS